jgi:PiT family inorganic phosphate transporter
LGTWYLGLPASSSHTLIGSIMGVGLANSMMSKGHVFGDGVNWGKVQEVFLSLLISPLVGFIFAGLLLIVMKAVIKSPDLYKEPPKDQPPPLWIRGLLVLTCTGVSFAHGSNDGQKGMGLLLLILIGILPGAYALNLATDSAAYEKLHATSVAIQAKLDAHVPADVKVGASDAGDELSAYLKAGAAVTPRTYGGLAALNQRLSATLASKKDFSAFTVDERKNVRTDIYLVSATIAKLAKTHVLENHDELEALNGSTGYRKQLESVTQFIPLWVKIAVALALGLGTMIGWKRIVVTVGEKIGKTHLTYAQGGSAELVAMCTILLADGYNLPVSTTHVLSSGVAGTMAANRSGLQVETLRNLLMAWVLTLPVCVLLGSMTFGAGLLMIAYNLTYVGVPVAALLFAAVFYWRWKADSANPHKHTPRVMHG